MIAGMHIICMPPLSSSLVSYVIDNILLTTNFVLLWEWMWHNCSGRSKAGFTRRHVCFLFNKNLMNGFLGDAKYTRTFARRYQNPVNKSWWMTFLVTQNTRGLSPFPSRRSTKMYAKAINIPDKFPWRVPLSWENSACSIPRQGNWVKGLTMWHRKISDLHEDFSIACSIFRNFPGKMSPCK